MSWLNTIAFACLVATVVYDQRRITLLERKVEKLRKKVKHESP